MTALSGQNPAAALGHSWPQITAVAPVLSDSILSPTLAGDMAAGYGTGLRAAESVEQKNKVSFLLVAESSGVRAMVCG